MAPSHSALIVATDTYEDQRLSALRAPGQDAQALGAVLRDPEIGGFDVAVLHNRPCQEVRIALDQFFSASRALDDVLLLHVSCHGIKDRAGRLFFAATDTQKDWLDSTAISAGFVTDLLKNCRSKRIVLLLDCCYSGAFTKGMLAKGDADVHVTERFQGEGRVILTASSALEYAWEGEERTGTGQRSVFTHAVVEGLRTGKADRDGDGFVTVDDLYGYVCDEVARSGAQQSPSRSSVGQGQLVVARSALGTRTLPDELLQWIKSQEAAARLYAILELRHLMKVSKPGLADTARLALEKLAKDDSKRVSEAALAALKEAIEDASIVIPLPDRRADLGSRPDRPCPSAIDGDGGATRTSEDRPGVPNSGQSAEGSSIIHPVHEPREESFPSQRTRPEAERAASSAISMDPSSQADVKDDTDEDSTSPQSNAQHRPGEIPVTKSSDDGDGEGQADPPGGQTAAETISQVSSMLTGQESGSSGTPPLTGGPAPSGLLDRSQGHYQDIRARGGAQLWRRGILILLSLAGLGAVLLASGGGISWVPRSDPPTPTPIAGLSNPTPAPPPPKPTELPVRDQGKLTVSPPGNRSPKSSSIEPNEIHRYTFEGRQGQTISVSVSPVLNNSIVIFTMSGPNGEILSNGRSYNNTLRETGNYSIEISNRSQTPGLYVIDVHEQ